MIKSLPKTQAVILFYQYSSVITFPSEKIISALFVIWLEEESIESETSFKTK